MLDRLIDKFFHLGEGYYLVELLGDLRARHAQDCAVQINILPAGQFRMKTGADFEQRADATVEFDPSCGRLRDPRQQFQERGLTRAVSSDDAYYFAGVNVEVNFFQRPKCFRI